MMLNVKPDQRVNRKLQDKRTTESNGVDITCLNLKRESEDNGIESTRLGSGVSSMVIDIYIIAIASDPTNTAHILLRATQFPNRKKIPSTEVLKLLARKL